MRSYNYSTNFFLRCAVIFSMLLISACTQYKVSNRDNTVVASSDPVAIISTGCRIESSFATRVYSHKKSLRQAKLAGRYTATYLQANNYPVGKVLTPFACYGEKNKEQLALERDDKTVGADQVSFPLVVDTTLSEQEIIQMQNIMDYLLCLPQAGHLPAAGSACENDLSEREMSLLKRYTNNAKFIMLANYKISEYTKGSTALRLLVPIGSVQTKSRVFDARLIHVADKVKLWSDSGRPEKNKKNVYFDKKNECQWSDKEPSEVRNAYADLVCVK